MADADEWLKWLDQVGFLPPDVSAGSAAPPAEAKGPVAVSARSAGDADQSEDSVKNPKGIEVTPATISLSPGDSTNLRALRTYYRYQPDDITDEVDWQSSSAFFTVDKHGKVTAAQLDGTPIDTQITATDPMTHFEGHAIATLDVNLPTGLRIEPDGGKLGPEEQIALRAIRVFPGGKRTEDATAKVTWSSSQSVAEVNAQGIVTAHGITGEANVIITAADPDTDLTATVTIVVSASHDITLEITPETVELAPGGSVALKAELVGKLGRQDVTKTTDWESSSALLTIDKDGNAAADAKALQTETVEIIATNRDADLTMKATVVIKVPSREVRKFATPFEDVHYFAGYEDKAKPRLENAVKTFLAAEKREDALDKAYEDLMRKKEELASAMSQVVADVRKNGNAVKADAQSAFHDELREEDLKAVLDIINQNLDDAHNHVVTAAGKLKSSFNTTQLHALQEEAKQMDEDIELTKDACKSLAAIEDPEELVQALLDLTADLTKRFMNKAADEAKALQEKLDDDNLKIAQGELDDAQKSSAAWAAQQIKTLDKLVANAKHAATHWQAVERKYDVTATDKGGFRFEKAGAVIKLGDLALKTAKDTGDLATLAQTSADDMLKFDPKPEVWLAQPDQDLGKLQTMRLEATSKVSLAQERQNEIADILKNIRQSVQDGRAALLEGDPAEP